MNNIVVITLDKSGEETGTISTVGELIYDWYHKINIPANDDTVVSCVLGSTQLYFETFGELMRALTGEYKK